MPKRRRILYLGGAILAFAAGIAGWLVPIVTGIPFLIAGVVLVAMASRRSARVVNAVERRLPHSWRRALRRGARKVPIRRLREAVQTGDDAGTCASSASTTPDGASNRNERKR
jgi:hypothetical protein